jgi:hypothetical protein
MEKIFSGFSGFYRLSEEEKLKDAYCPHDMGFAACGGGLEVIGHGGFWRSGIFGRFS